MSLRCATCSTQAVDPDRKSRHRHRLQRARDGACLRARQRPPDSLRGRAAPRRRRRGLLRRPGLARERLGWHATRGLDAMCVDSWRWQSMNPNGFDPVMTVPHQCLRARSHRCLPRGHGRRQRHAAVAAVARPVPEAVSVASGRAAEPLPARGAAARRPRRPGHRGRAALHRRQRGAPVPDARPAPRAGDQRRHRHARADGAEHGTGDDAGSVARPSAGLPIPCWSSPRPTRP